MEIILTQDVDNLGMAGQVLKVSPGYARNYLLPGAKALPATPHNLKTLAIKRQDFERRSLAVKDEALELKRRLDALVLTVVRKSVDKGKLYGAVTAQDLVEAAALEGVVLERKRLKIAEPIKAVGDYEISARLHPEITGSFRLKVVAAAPDPVPVTEPARPRRPRRSDSESDVVIFPLLPDDAAPASTEPLTPPHAAGPAASLPETPEAPDAPAAFGGEETP
ncbi:MAG: 50S ribosomal protein L9 [Deltaproteobacteria bacterium]|jgi:large subunit ribosomal protein L9|nr:50S ribosomal protein L9 [Deltaproteobacteria bacterium]